VSVHAGKYHSCSCSLILLAVYLSLIPLLRAGRSGTSLVTVPVHLDHSSSDFSSTFDAAAAEANQAGRPVKALLLTNPTNPQGLLYSRSQLQSCIQWCLRNKVHYIRQVCYNTAKHTEANLAAACLFWQSLLYVSISTGRQGLPLCCQGWVRRLAWVGTQIIIKHDVRCIGKVATLETC